MWKESQVVCALLEDSGDQFLDWFDFKRIMYDIRS